MKQPQPGTGRIKVQLHTHSARSFDSHWPIDQLQAVYGGHGFAAVFLTDHDRSASTKPTVSHQSGLPLLLPGTELSLSIPFWPLGPHLVLLGLARFPPALRWAAHRSGWPRWPWGGSKLRDLFAWLARPRQAPILPLLAHPHWPGNLGTGRWAQYLPALLDAWQLLPPGTPLLVEVLNPHSPTGPDRQFWHTLLEAAAPEHPLYVAGVDDAHHPGEAGQAWVELNPPAPPRGTPDPPIEAPEVYRCLLAGNFVATSGPSLRTQVDANATTPRRLQVWSEPGARLRLVGRAGQLLQEAVGPTADWLIPSGTGEGVVQVEAYSSSASTVSGSFWPNVAFSQPIWT